MNAAIPSGSRGRLILAAWGVVLAASALPEILFAGHYPTAPLHWLSLGKAVLLLGLWLAARRVGALRPLAPLLVALLGLHLSWVACGALVSSGPARQFFGGVQDPFLKMMLPVQAVRVGVACVVTAILWWQFRRRPEFFLQNGSLRARTGARGPSWLVVGPLLTMGLGLGTFLYMRAGTAQYHPSLLKAAGYLPLILLFSVTNSLGEELTYRLGILRPALEAVGAMNALGMSAVYFGLAHYYGLPAGVLGVAMASVLGAIAGRAVLDSKGIAWAVIIHFVQDVWIFWYLAAICVRSHS